MRKPFKGIQRFYSPENFDFSYAYNKLEHRDFEIESQEEIASNRNKVNRERIASQRRAANRRN